jgi:hypothetical protein
VNTIYALGLYVSNSLRYILSFANDFKLQTVI